MEDACEADQCLGHTPKTTQIVSERVEPKKASEFTSIEVDLTSAGQPRSDREINGQVEWVTIREAAQRVGRSATTIRRAIASGNLISQRSGDHNNAPWLVSVHSLAEIYDHTAVTTAAMPLARQLSAVLTQLAEANRVALELTERAARAETEAEHLRDRLQEQESQAEQRLREQREQAQQQLLEQREKAEQQLREQREKAEKRQWERLREVREEPRRWWQR